MTQADLLKALWDAGNVEIAANDVAKARASALEAATTDNAVAQAAKAQAAAAVDTAFKDYTDSR